jgi:hypothetical protein
VPNTSGYAELKPSDLQDETLFALNQRMRYLYQKVSGVYGQNSPNLLSSPTLATAYSSQQTAQNVSPNEFITNAVANKLYGIAAIQAAINSGKLQVGGPNGQQVAQAALFTIITLAQLPTAGTLATNADNAGMTFFISDYYHWLEFNGTGYQWHPWESDGSAYYRLADAPPNWGRWASVSGGGTAAFLQSNGTLGLATMATVTAGFFTGVWFRQ